MLACVNKVTKMNCSSFFLFKLGFSFVKKRTGKRTLRTQVPRYICWLPPGMMDLGTADSKKCPWTHSAGSYDAPCGTTATGCPHLLSVPLVPLAPRRHLQGTSVPKSAAQLRGRTSCPCPLQGEGHLPVAHRRPGSALR